MDFSFLRMKSISSFQYTSGSPRGPRDSPRRNEWQKNSQKLEAGGKPSTWFPLGELVELSKLKYHAHFSFFRVYEMFVIFDCFIFGKYVLSL